MGREEISPTIKLRKGMCWWQGMCMFQFALFSLLFILWGVPLIAQIPLWGFCGLLTMYHLTVYILFHFTIKNNGGENE